MVANKASKVEEARQGVMSLVDNIGWDTIANSLDLVPSALDALIAAVREDERERCVADVTPEAAKQFFAKIGGVPDSKALGYFGRIDDAYPEQFIPVMGLTFGDLRAALASLLEDTDNG